MSIPAVDMSIDPADVAAVNDALSQIPGGAQRAIRDALNRTGRAGRRQIIRGIAGELALTQRAIGERVRLRPARRDRDEATIATYPRPFGLKHFKPTRTARGVRARISKTRGRQEFTRSFHAMPRRGGKPQWFQRVGDARYPLRRLESGSLIDLLAEQGQSFGGVAHDLQPVLQQNLRSRVAFELSRAGRRTAISRSGGARAAGN